MDNKTANEEEWDDTLLCKAYTKALTKAEEISKGTPPEHIPDININECAASVDWTWKKVDEKPRAWRVGMRCRAVFSKDGRDYEAVIDSIEGSKARVKFEGYNNKQNVHLATLQESLGEKAVEKQIEEALIENMQFSEYERSLTRDKVTHRMPTIGAAPFGSKYRQKMCGNIDEDGAVTINNHSDSISSDDYIYVPALDDSDISYNTSEEGNVSEVQDELVKIPETSPNTSEEAAVKFAEKPQNTYLMQWLKIADNPQNTAQDESVKIAENPQNTSQVQWVKMAENPQNTAQDVPVKIAENSRNTAQDESVKIAENPQNTSQVQWVKMAENPQNTAQDVPVKIAENSRNTAQDESVKIAENPQNTSEDRPEARISWNTFRQSMSAYANSDHDNLKIHPGYSKIPSKEKLRTLLYPTPQQCIEYESRIKPLYQAPIYQQERPKLYIETFPTPSTHGGQSNFYFNSFKGQNAKGDEHLFIEAKPFPVLSNPHGPQKYYIEASTLLGSSNSQPQPSTTSGQYGLQNDSIRKIDERNGNPEPDNSNEHNNPERATNQEENNTSRPVHGEQKDPNKVIGPGYFLPHTESTATTANKGPLPFHSYYNPQGPNQAQAQNSQKYAQPQGPQAQRYPHRQSQTNGQVYPPHGKYQGQSYPQPQGKFQGHGCPKPQGYSHGHGYPHPHGNYKGQGNPQPHGNFQGQGCPQPQGYYQGQGYPQPNGNVQWHHSRSNPQESNFYHFQGYSQIQGYNSAEVFLQPQPAYAVVQQYLAPMTLAAPANIGLRPQIPPYASSGVIVGTAPVNITPGPINQAAPLNNNVPIPIFVASGPVNVAPAPANVASEPTNAAPLNNTAPIAPEKSKSEQKSSAAPAKNNSPLSHVASESVTNSSGLPKLPSGAINFTGAVKSNPLEPFRFTAQPSNVATDKSQSPTLPGPSAAAQMKSVPFKLPVTQAKTAPAANSGRFEMPPIPNIEELVSNIAPIAPPLPFPLAEALSDCDRVQSAMLLSWYSSGYYTGLYQAMLKKTNDGEQPAKTE